MKDIERLEKRIIKLEQQFQILFKYILDKEVYKTCCILAQEGEKVYDDYYSHEHKLEIRINTKLPNKYEVRLHRSLDEEDIEEIVT